MKKILTLAAAAVLAIQGLSAQEMLRYNYRHNGFVYTGSEKSTIADKTHPFTMRLEKVVFKDNTYAYRITTEFTKDRNISIPKSAKFVVTFPDGKFISAPQSSSPASNKGVYYFEEANVKKMIDLGVKTIEIVVSWDVNGYYTIQCGDGAFVKALKSQYDAVSAAKVPTTELGDNIAEIADRTRSRTTITKAETVTGASGSLRMSLNSIYYKTDIKEDFDLNMEIVGGQDKFFAIDTPVTFTLSDGTSITMKQEKDAYGVIYCYPTATDVKRLSRGTVKSISVGDLWSLTFDARAYSRTLDKQYNSLMQVSPL